jgi:type IV secretory pathway TraG/TraD family ATPase VirD4
MSFLFLVIGLVAGFGVGAFVLWIGKTTSRGRIMQSLGTALYLVKIPRPEASQKSGSAEGGDFKTELTHFEQLLGAMATIKGSVSFELAVPHVGEEIHFYIAVPKSAAETAAKQIQGLWNGASVSAAPDDYNIFNIHGAHTAAYLKLKDHFALPVRTYAELGIDSFESVVGAFAKINEIGEGAALQMMIRPAPKESKKTVQKYIELLKKGESIKKIFGGNFPATLEHVGEVFNPKSKEDQVKEKQERVVDDEAVKALQAKIAKPLFLVSIRLVASAGSQFQADDILDGIAAGFNQFASPQRNEFKVVKMRNPKKIIDHFIFREFDASQAMVLSSEEIASFYHFPISTTETPRVKWLKSKEAAPPENLPKQGLLLGESVFRGQSRPIYMTYDDRRRHLYIVGQTGTGKTTMIDNLVLQDIKNGKGVAVIDPHGELAEHALSFVPASRLDDVIYFNPGDLARPLGLNMLDFNFDRPEEKTFIVNEMQSIFDRLFDQASMGPMFQQYMRNALLLLMEDAPNEPATLVEVPRVFTDADFRKRKLARIRNPVVVDFWEKEAVKAGGEASLANMTPYITSKFGGFISNDYLRPIIGQPKSAFNFRDVMDSGKILIVNLSKGRIGDINAGLLGMVIIGKILMAALSRADMADASERRDFTLYIDEFQNFTTDSIATILSEARKYRLNLTVAHQFIAQLTDKIKDAVFGNVGSMVVMRVGAQDAEFLVKQFEPVFNENDLINIDNLHAFVKLLVNGQTAKPFNLKVGTESWTGGDKELAEKLKEYSRTKFGADRATVEAEIQKRLRE